MLCLKYQKLFSYIMLTYFYLPSQGNCYFYWKLLECLCSLLLFASIWQISSSNMVLHLYFILALILGCSLVTRVLKWSWAVLFNFFTYRCRSRTMVFLHLLVNLLLLLKICYILILTQMSQRTPNLDLRWWICLCFDISISNIDIIFASWVLFVMDYY